jgi:hypothetical protein
MKTFLKINRFLVRRSGDHHTNALENPLLLVTSKADEKGQSSRNRSSPSYQEKKAYPGD